MRHNSNVRREIFIPLNAYVSKGKVLNNLNSHLKNLKKEQKKLKASEKKEVKSKEQ